MNFNRKIRRAEAKKMAKETGLSVSEVWPHFRDWKQPQVAGDGELAADTVAIASDAFAAEPKTCMTASAIQPGRLLGSDHCRELRLWQERSERRKRTWKVIMMLACIAAAAFAIVAIATQF